MPVTTEQHLALIWLNKAPTADTFVTDEMLRQLASQGMIEYDPASGTVQFTDLDRQTYRDLTGHWPTRYVSS